MPQSFGAMYIHAIFSTKHREPKILDDWRPELFRFLGGIINQHDCQCLTVGGVADHVHLLFRLSRTRPIAVVIAEIKKQSSAWINQYKAEFHWQSGYAAFSVSASSLDAVREYIIHQEQHHKRQTFQDEYRTWLQRYDLEYDERYLWE